MKLNILYADRLPQKQEIGSQIHMKCPTLAQVAYPYLDAQACPKYFRNHTDLFVLKYHVYYFYLFRCNSFKNNFGGSNHHGFPYRGIGVVPPTTQNFAHSHHLEKFSSRQTLIPTNFYTPNQMLILPLSNNFHVITPIETSFLVYYNFILSVNPSHANFNFNLMFNIYRMLHFPLKKQGENPPHPITTFQKPSSCCSFLVFMCCKC